MEEIDISCNFEHLEDLIDDTSGFPKQPAKPSAPKNGSPPSQFRQFADALEAYEKEMSVFKIDRQSYYSAKDKLREIWDKKLRFEYAKWPDEVFNLARRKAYEDGHSEGLRRIRENMDELSDIVEAALNHRNSK